MNIFMLVLHIIFAVASIYFMILQWKKKEMVMFVTWGISFVLWLAHIIMDIENIVG